MLIFFGFRYLMFLDQVDEIAKYVFRALRNGCLDNKEKKCIV